MKVVKLNEGLYKKAEKVSRVHGVKINDLIAQALSEGIDVLSERNVVGLYRDQKATEMLSLDIWEIIEKLKKADLHIDYSRESLTEDLE